MSAQVKAAVFLGFEESVRQLGGDPGFCLQYAGLARKDLKDPDAFVGYSQFLHALDAALKSTGREDFGIALARHQSIAALGRMGDLLQKLPTVGQALQTGFQLSNAYVTGMKIELSISGGTAVTWMEKVASQNLAVGLQQDHSMALGTQIMRHLIGRDWNPDVIYLAHHPPTDISRYLSYFRCPVLFDQELSALAFPRACLDQGIDTACERDLRKVLGAMQSECAEAERPINERVRYAILAQMQGGDYHIDTVAKRLGLSRRSLQRRLEDVDESYLSILKAMRLENAKRFLASTSIPITQISSLLGYSETSAFSRAFASLTGVSPRRWRRQSTE